MNESRSQERSFLLALLLAAVGAILASYLVFAHATRVSDKAQIDAALAAARTYSDSISAFRQFYITEVAPTEIELDMLTKESPHTRLAKLTDPYTASIDLAERSLSEVGKGRYRVYSHFPWSIRQPRPSLSATEKLVLDQIVAQNSPEVVQIVESELERRIYLGTPILMKETCVACHNNHPDSPARHWEVGDVRGVQTVEIALPAKASMLAFSTLSSFPTLWGGYSLFVLAMGSALFLYARQKLRRVSELSAEGILDSLGEAVLSIDGSDKILALNSAAGRLFGYRPEEAIGMSAGQLISGFDTASTDFVGAQEGVGIRHDGTTFDCSMLTRPERDWPEDRRVISLRDITAEKQVREKLANTGHITAVGRLAAGVAHEFNNLLTVILGNSELLRERLSNAEPDVVKKLDNVLGAGERGASLVESLVANASQRPRWPKVFQASLFYRAIEPTLLTVIGNGTRVESSIEDDTEFFADIDQIEAAVVALATRIAGVLRHPEKIEVTMRPVDGRLSQIEVVGRGETSDSGVIVMPFVGTVDLEFAAIRNLVQQTGGELRVDDTDAANLSASIYLPRRDPKKDS